MTRYLWDHKLISYVRAGLRPETGSQVYTVRYDGTVMGEVTRSQPNPHDWVYRPVGISVWTGPYWSRADAADHLVSYCYPSAPWLGAPIKD